MESFAKLKRRTTDLMHSLPQNLPSMPQVHMPHLPQLPQRKKGGYAMKGTWEHVDVPHLPRSSHTLDVVEGRAYIFGGEADDRKPLDNDMHVITLPANSAGADYYAVKAKPSPKSDPASSVPEKDEEDDEDDDSDEDDSDSDTASEASGKAKDKGKGKATAQVPSPRIGHASAVIGTRIFIFGGRRSPNASSTLDEGGRVWVFETKTSTWTYLDPHHTSPVPPPRSYFAAVATDKPRDFAIKPLRRADSWKQWAEGDSAQVGIPQRPIAGNVAATATDEEDLGFGTLIIHGGLLSGDEERTADVWAFDVRSTTWKELPAAPGPGRSGAALAIAKGRLYRFGGFDGSAVLGGQLDALALSVDEFNDRVSKGEIGVFARGSWETIVPPTPAAPAPPPAQSTTEEGGDGAEAEAGTTTETGKLVPAPGDDKPWPQPRSTATMELVLGSQGREYLILMLGERGTSSRGDEEGESAGSGFWNDVWAFQVPPLGGTAASLTDAVWHAVGRKTGELQWTRLEMGPYDDEADLDVQGPGARGARPAGRPRGGRRGSLWWPHRRRPEARRRLDLQDELSSPKSFQLGF